jgi:hypothetical protein
MSDDTATSAESPTVEVTSTYRARRGNGTEVVEETMVLDNYEVERLLEQMLRDSLDGVDARTVANELEARSR